MITVPEGTVVKDLYSGEVLAELLHHGDRWLAAAGGRGGRGNAKFLTNRRRAPRFAEQGEHGEERWLKLEMQLMADVALVGFPNVGKSTLISVISAAKPKIADYPFTTLEPNLGVVRLDDTTEFVVADIPGLIEGASEGKGLGHQFLRHVERARVLCLLVDLAAARRHVARGAGAGPARTSSATTGPSCSSGPGSSSAPRPTSPAPSTRASSGSRPTARPASSSRPSPATGSARSSGRWPGSSTRPARPRRTPRASCCCGPSRAAPPSSAQGDNEFRVQRPRRRAGRRPQRHHVDRRHGATSRYRLDRLGVNKLLARAGAADGDVVWIGDFSFEYRDA